MLGLLTNATSFVAFERLGDQGGARYRSVRPGEHKRDETPLGYEDIG